MKVVRVNDFDIPSDENDYDELVAFADTMASIEQFEAIPKADYEARLKADMIAMLTEIQLEIEEMKMKSLTEKEIWNNAIGVCSSLVKQKIDSLKGENNG